MSRKSNPLNLPGSATEDEFHVAVAELLDVCLLPPTFYTTFPAGYGKLSKATGGRLRAKGMKAGMPDILIFGRAALKSTHVVGLELKTSVGSLTSKQRAMHALLQAVSVRTYVVRNLEEVMGALDDALIPHRNMRVAA